MRKIPVFFHIPKNAGTYVSDYCLVAFRRYCLKFTDWYRKWRLDKDRDPIKILQIIQNNRIIGRVLIGDPDFYLDSHITNLSKLSKHDFSIEFNDLNSALFQKLFVFAVIIEDAGFRIHKNILNMFQSYEHHKFIIFRDEFSRQQSLYHYLTTDASKHERNRNIITQSTFEGYILSEQFEENSLIRKLLNILDNTIITESHLKEAYRILTDFNIYDIKNVDKAIYDTFIKCYDIDMKNIELKPWDIITKNENHYKKINFEDLSEDAQQAFNRKTQWVKKLYGMCIK
jgi:hypothetical protein